MRILALDLSKRSTGWACWSDDGSKPIFGTWVLGSEYTSPGQVYCELHKQISALHSLGKINRIFHEQQINHLPHAQKTNLEAIEMAACLIGHVHSWSYAMGIREPVPVNMKTWRKSFHANLPKALQRVELKAESVKEAKALGFNVRNDDESDAIGILDWAVTRHLGLNAPWRSAMTLPLMSATRG